MKFKKEISTLYFVYKNKNNNYFINISVIHLESVWILLTLALFKNKN